MFVRCVIKIEWQKFEQHGTIKFCVKFHEFTTVTYGKLQMGLRETTPIKGTKFFLEGQKMNTNLVWEDL